MSLHRYLTDLKVIHAVKDVGVGQGISQGLSIGVRPKGVRPNGVRLNTEYMYYTCMHASSFVAVGTR